MFMRFFRVLTDFTSFMVLLGVVATAFLSALRAVSGCWLTADVFRAFYVL